jgi:hypothetical protein
MSDDWVDYLTRREKTIADRQNTNPVGTPASTDAHRKAGCYDCEALWAGDDARISAATHQENTGHSVWFIDSV